ncbi:DUF6221 family protein [Planosporangium sp. 12N6]|uniref:DUF6221 family protein n=1 Tax=Planosporangium spinosum TaxID=3402278 RepID=UPI003CED7720
MDDDLIAWLSAQLDDDERAARAASPGPWGYDPSHEFRMPGSGPLEFVGAGVAPDFHGIAATGPADDPQSMADAGHIARHDPVHVCRDVEAKRKIIERYGGSEVVRLLASGYRDRPGYRAEWAP